MQSSDIDGHKPWFRAKRFGWGWSWPLTWQGWLVLGTYCALVILSAALVPARQDSVTAGACVVLLTAILIAICWRTGEAPRWRWGDGDR